LRDYLLLPPLPVLLSLLLPVPLLPVPLLPVPLLPVLPPALPLPLPLMLPELPLEEPLELGEEGDDGLVLGEVALDPELFDDDPLLPALSRWQAATLTPITVARSSTAQDCLRMTTLLSLRLKCPYASLRLGRYAIM